MTADKLRKTHTKIRNKYNSKPKSISDKSSDEHSSQLKMPENSCSSPSSDYHTRLHHQHLNEDLSNSIRQLKDNQNICGRSQTSVTCKDNSEGCCQYHIKGMLNRDQRSVVNKLRDDVNHNCVVIHKCYCEWTLVSCVNPCGRRIKKCRQRWRFKAAQRFKEVLLLATYLLPLLLLPYSLTAPTKMNSGRARMDTDPKWIKPCGPGASEEIPADIQTMVVSDHDLLSQIIHQAGIALADAENFKGDYAQKTFYRGFDEMHRSFHSFPSYDWLPSLPKKLGDKTTLEHLNNLELNKSLLDAYEDLQKIAVGLEQIVWDLEDEEKIQLRDNFRRTEYTLRALLCEIEVAIVEREIERREEIRRDIMTEEFRNMNDSSKRHLRDFIIFREYMNALEYVIQVFEHFKDKL